MLPQWYLNTPDTVPQALPETREYEDVVATPAQNCMRNTLPLVNMAQYIEMCKRSYDRNHEFVTVKSC